MALTKSELNKAFRVAVESEFADIPKSEGEINYQFSNKFLAKMDKLIKRERSFVWHVTNTNTKRIVIAIIALFIILSTQVNMVAIGKSIVQFIMHKDPIKYTFEFTGDLRYSIEKEYFFDLPDGYVLESRIEGGGMIEKDYINEQGKRILIYQVITGTVNYSLDSEHNNIQIIETDSGNIIIYKMTKSAIATFVYDGYLFEINFKDDEFNTDSILSFIQTIK